MATVSYARLVNLGNYENERAEYTDELQPGESVADGYARVRATVHELLGKADSLRAQQRALEALQRQQRDMTRGALAMLVRWQEAHTAYGDLAELLQAHGVTLEPLSPALVPPERLTGADINDDDDPQF